MDLHATIDGRFTIRSHGRDQLAYYQEHSTITEVITNVATGEHVTRVERVLDKDLRVTDNGDGTLTVLVLATGNSTVYDESGKAIARNPGQVRYALLIATAEPQPTTPMTSSSSSCSRQRVHRRLLRGHRGRDRPAGGCS